MLLDWGYRVVAADRDTSMLADLAGNPGCEIVTIDLEDGSPWRLGGDYDGIVVTNYLHRPLFPALRKALAAEGVLIYETFAAGNERYGKPSNPAFLLRPGELLDCAAPLTVIAFEQGLVDAPRPAVVQRIAAFKGSFPGRLPSAPAS